jgi:hypothetical protein
MMDLQEGISSAPSRRTALLTMLRERRLEYIPATTYGVDRFSHEWMARDPSFHRVLEFTDRYDHIFVLHLSYYASFGVTDVLGLWDRDALDREVRVEGGATHYHLKLHTPRGDLTANYTENEGMRTVWRHDHLMKTDEDVDRFLSAPFVPNPPDLDTFRRTREALGESGLMEIETPTPLCLVVENMPYDQFMVRALQDPVRVEALLDRASELIARWLQALLEAGFGPVFRFFGPEYAAPPMMSPRFFQKVVVDRDRPLIELIHRYGGFVRYHCHGPIARIVDDMLAMGVDMTDPCEPPPSGDIPLRELADRVGRDMILMGNIQLDAIERAEPEEIDRQVAQAIEEVGGRAPLILCTTAFPVTTPLPAVTERNLIQYLLSAEKHGGKGRPVQP